MVFAVGIILAPDVAGGQCAEGTACFRSEIVRRFNIIRVCPSVRGSATATGEQFKDRCAAVARVNRLTPIRATPPASDFIASVACVGWL
jgi:hypothetical protein